MFCLEKVGEEMHPPKIFSIVVMGLTNARRSCGASQIRATDRDPDRRRAGLRTQGTQDCAG